ncbi:MAG TPA: hypothetical protein VGJ15_02060 [Pirellulales bacterium]
MSERDQVLALVEKLRDAAKKLCETGNTSDAKRCELVAHNIAHEEDTTLEEAQVMCSVALREQIS